jgi:hypothetical protein
MNCLNFESTKREVCECRNLTIQFICLAANRKKIDQYALNNSSKSQEEAKNRHMCFIIIQNYEC